MKMLPTQAALTFGVEIEVAGTSAIAINDALRTANVSHRNRGYTHETTSYWKTVTDASCGFEVVSPVLHGEAGLEEVERVAKSLADARIGASRACGLHVHIGVNHLTIAQLRNVMKAFIRDEHHFDSILPTHRRSNGFARSNRAQIGTDLQMSEMFNRINECRNRGQLIQLFHQTSSAANVRGAGRYRKLNLLSILQHGTIEFRQHSGTVDATKIAAWVRLVTGFVDYAVHAPMIRPEPRSFEMFAATAPGADARRFLAARREQFASA